MRNSAEAKGNDGFLNLSAGDWRDALTEAALAKSISPIILEKDFWVCWLLSLIFSDSEFGDHVVFKGGTSLSKVYGVIERFSEDVDLGIDPEFVGISENLFDSLASRTSRDEALAKMQVQCGNALQRLNTRLEARIRSALGPPLGEESWLTYEFDERVHSPVVHFRYPGVYGDGLDYIRREVKLEVGTLTDQRPLGHHPVRPWVADAFPHIFKDWTCEVIALELSRTFWEKATILHAEHHRREGQALPVRHARHYSDFACLLTHPEADTFLVDHPMCRRVAEWKDRVFARKWARYELARHGTFRLVPPPARLGTLEKDYAAMRPMFLSEPLPFDELIHRLQDAEQRMNAP